jgi:AP endonuclease-2
MLMLTYHRNVNGIRNPFSYPPWNTTARTFPAMFDILASDIIVMQELKIQRKDLRDDMVLLDGWDCFFSLPKHKKGYSGVGIYTRNATCAPIRAEEGLLGVLPSASGVAFRDLDEQESIGGYPSERQIMEIGVDPLALDAEGRCVVLEFPAFVLFGIYSPANSNGLRDGFRYGFICALDCRIRNLIRQGKNVVLVGDLNVSRNEMDTASAVEDLRREGLTHDDYVSTPNRRIFNQLIIGGDVVGQRDEGREDGVLWDTTRAFHPDRRGMYTHWEQKINARPGNFGSRIDFVLVCSAMQSWIKDANIQEGLLGSDHCPVYADFHDRVQHGGEELDLVDIMSEAGTFVKGERKLEWKISNSPAFSAKRMPEFDKRRSIKSMFAAPAAKKAEIQQPEQKVSMAGYATSNRANAKAVTTIALPASQTSTSQSTPSPVKRKLSLPSQDKSVKRTKNDTPSSSKSQQSLKGFFQAKPVPTDATSEDARSPVRTSAFALPSKDALPKTQAQEREAADLGESDKDDKDEKDGTKTSLIEPDNAHAPQPSQQTSPTTPKISRPSSQPTKHPPNSATSQRISTPPSAAISSCASPTSPSNTNLPSRLHTSAKWSQLFTKPSAPLCAVHKEPCKTMLTKKKGTNQGRSFWMCSRPIGPTGKEEKEGGANGEWRCGTFIWSSDWRGGAGVNGRAPGNGTAGGDGDDEGAANDELDGA